MSKSKTFNVPVKRATGEEMSEVEVKELISKPHDVEFRYAGAIFVMRVSPSQITSKGSTRIEAIQTKLARVAAFGREESDPKKSALEKAKERAETGKAIEVEAISALLTEMNQASVERAVDAIMLEEDGSLMCNYRTDASSAGLTPLDFKEELMKNAPLGQSVVNAFEDWYGNFTGSSQDGGETKTETGATLTTDTSQQVATQ